MSEKRILVDIDSKKKRLDRLSLVHKEINAIKKNIGSQLRDLRNANGMDNKSISPSQLKAIEDGYGNYTVDTFLLHLRSLNAEIVIRYRG